MIDVRGLTKRYGSTTAVDQVSFVVGPGRVTGFLGPNGAGKSTTMRLILGLDQPTSGTATIDGQDYVRIAAPMQHVGTLLEAGAVVGSRTARAHLRWLAAAAGVDRRRVDEVLGLVGLTDAASKRLSEFSLGMSQRLGLATALLGDPPVLVLDEPTNGLDPDGIAWVRDLLRDLAAEGRTILLSSHQMSEVEQVADHVVVIGRGRLLADVAVAELTTLDGRDEVRVVSPDARTLADALQRAGAQVEIDGHTDLKVSGVAAARVGETALQAGIVVHELTPRRASLEEAFMRLTHGEARHVATDDRTGLSDAIDAVRPTEDDHAQ